MTWLKPRDKDGWFSGAGGTVGLVVGLVCFYLLVRNTDLEKWGGGDLVFELAIAAAAIGALIGHVVVYWFEASRILREERKQKERAQRERE